MKAETAEAQLTAFLREHEIPFAAAQHPPFFTCSEADAYELPLTGLQTKNLFLRDEHGRYYLALTACEKRLDFKRLSRSLGVDKVRFGSEEELRDLLGLTPGAVTVLALGNDPSGRVGLLVDAQYWPSAAYLCHPLVNTATLSLEHAALLRFLEVTEHVPVIVEM